MTLELGDIERFERTKSHFAVLVDGREGDHQGVILQHPLYDELIQEHHGDPTRISELIAELSQHQVNISQLDALSSEVYVDPLSESRHGRDYAGEWIVGVEPVSLLPKANINGQDTVNSGLVVLVQEAYTPSVAPVDNLGSRMLREGINGLVAFVAVFLGLWLFVYNLLRESRRLNRAAGESDDSTSLHTRETMELPGPLRRS